MVAEAPSITLNLLDKEYQVACPLEEQEALRQAARSLDNRLREIRSNGNVMGLERIAIMAALNLSYELQTVQTNHAGHAQDQDLIKSISEKVDNAIDRFSD